MEFKWKFILFLKYHNAYYILNIFYFFYSIDLINLYFLFYIFKFYINK